jgi:phosphate starvation-inducible protein PhoH
VNVLEGVPDIAFVRLDRRDVVRHRLVQRIVDAYGAAEGPPGGGG